MIMCALNRVQTWFGARPERSTEDMRVHNTNT